MTNSIDAVLNLDSSFSSSIDTPSTSPTLTPSKRASSSSLYLRIDQLRDSILHSASEGSSSPSLHRQQTIDLFQEYQGWEHQSLLRSSVTVLTDQCVKSPVRQHSPYFDLPLKNIKEEEEVEAFIKNEQSLGVLKQAERVCDFLERPSGSKQSQLPQKTQEIAKACFEGQSISVVDKNQRLGGGAQGAVYRGTLLETPCAVKVCYDTNSDLFAKEYDALVRLSHPHILPLLAAEGNAFYLPLGKKDLSTIMIDLDADEASASENFKILLSQIANGMNYLHDQGFVHRDLKPENILISQDNQILIADLGLVDSIGNIIDTPIAQNVMGTPKYSAFETMCGDLTTSENCTKRDVWSLGIILWELLSKHGDRKRPHPCLDPSTTYDPKSMRLILVSALGGVYRRGGFQEGELRAQLDTEKVRKYDPDGSIVTLMEACLVVDPNRRISMQQCEAIMLSSLNNDPGLPELLKQIQQNAKQQCSIELKPQLATSQNNLEVARPDELAKMMNDWRFPCIDA